MEELKKLVDELENEYNVDKQIIILQSIATYILNNFIIKVSDTIIEPLRLEAYYYPYKSPEKFNDPCAHKCFKKIKKFGELYFIESRYGYPGIDLCLSNGDYYLSFLIKNSRIGDKYYKQMDLYDRFEANKDTIEKAKVLEKIEYNKKPVYFTSRVGISKSKTDFAKKPLSALTEISIPKIFDFESGFAKEWTVANYLYQNGQECTDENIIKHLRSKSENVKKIYKTINENTNL